MTVRKWGNAGTVMLILCLIFIFPFSSSAISDPGSNLQSTVIFTPHITPVNFTATIEATVPSPLLRTAQPSPLPHPGASPQPVETVEPYEDRGGTEAMGYDYVEGSQPPTWMIWWNDQITFYSPETPAEASLLNESFREVTRYTDEMETLTDEMENRRRSSGSLFWEALGVVGGGVAAGFSCPGVPFTFWLAGGTGWTCAGGLLSVISSIGAGGVTINEIGEINKKIADAQENAIDAYNQAEGIFQDLIR